MIRDSFRAEIYIDPEEYEEMPLRDRKAVLPNFFTGRACMKKRAEFLRDVIALANTARLFGEPAYLIFGLDDEGNILDLKDSLRVYDRGETTPWEGFRHSIGQFIREYIEPSLVHWDLKHGEVDGKEVGYLLIKPYAARHKFQVKKKLKSGREVMLEKSQSWIRFGESKYNLRNMPFESMPYEYSYAEVPYVLPSIWLKYFEALSSCYIQKKIYVGCARFHYI
ncbi:MAG: helix-turn-helix domain-containing protein [Anaerolineae bacterium]